MLIIAHRLSTIRSADRVVLLRDGPAVDAGAHAGLLSRCPEYRAAIDASSLCSGLRGERLTRRKCRASARVRTPSVAARARHVARLGRRGAAGVDGAGRQVEDVWSPHEAATIL